MGGPATNANDQRSQKVGGFGRPIVTLELLPLTGPPVRYRSGTSIRTVGRCRQNQGESSSGIGRPTENG